MYNYVYACMCITKKCNIYVCLSVSMSTVRIHSFILTA